MRTPAPEPDLTLITEDTPRWQAYMQAAFMTAWTAATATGIVALLAVHPWSGVSAKIVASFDTAAHAVSHLNPLTITAVGVAALGAALIDGARYRSVAHTLWSGTAGAAVIVLVVAMASLGRAVVAASDRGQLTAAMFGAAVAAAFVLVCAALRTRLPEYPTFDDDRATPTAGRGGAGRGGDSSDASGGSGGSASGAAGGGPGTASGGGL